MSNTTLNGLPDQSSYRVGQPVFLLYKKEADKPPTASPAIILQKMLVDVWSEGKSVSKITYTFKVKVEGRRPGEFVEEDKSLKDLKDAKIFHSLSELKSFWLDQVISKFNSRIDETKKVSDEFFEKYGVYVDDYKELSNESESKKPENENEDDFLNKVQQSLSKRLTVVENNENDDDDDDDDGIGPPPLPPVSPAKLVAIAPSFRPAKTELAKETVSFSDDVSNPYSNIIQDDVSIPKDVEERVLAEAEEAMKKRMKNPLSSSDIDKKIDVDLGSAKKRKRVLPGRA